MISLLKLRSRIPVATDQAILVEEIRESVMDQFESLSGWIWREYTDEVVVLEPDTERSLTLCIPYKNITTLTTVRTRSLGNATWTTLPVTSYDSAELNRLVRIGQTWEELIELTITGGYAAAPEDIQEALITQAKFQLDRFSDEKISINSQGSKGGSAQYIDSPHHPHFLRVVDYYRRRA